MPEPLPIDEFKNPENIINLQELIGFDSLFEVISVLFSDGEWAKPGCFINAKWVREIDDVQQCKEDVSTVLTEENIQHDYEDGTECPMIFIGNLDLLPEQTDDFFARCPNDLTDAEHKAVGRFIGVPDEDNVYIEDSENETDEIIYPKDAVEIEDNQLFYLNLLSWYSAPTEDGVNRALKCGKAIYDALQQAIDAHPEYETELRLCLHAFMTGTSDKFYGSLSPQYAEHLYERYSKLIDEAYETYDEDTLKINETFADPRYY